MTLKTQPKVKKNESTWCSILTHLNTDKVVKISTQIERLEAENYKLLKQMEWSNHAHELTVKENVRHISALVSEKNVKSIQL